MLDNQQLAVYEMKGLKNWKLAIKRIYKPKYLALNLLIGIAYYALFLYLAAVQGGGAIMPGTPWILVFGLIATSSITLTIVIYSISNTRNNQAKASGTAVSLGTIVTGTGLCGCATTFPAVIAAGIGISTTGVYALGSFLKNYNLYIYSGFIIMNLFVIGYYLNKFSKRECKVR